MKPLGDFLVNANHGWREEHWICSIRCDVRQALRFWYRFVALNL